MEHFHLFAEPGQRNCMLMREFIVSMSVKFVTRPRIYRPKRNNKAVLFTRIGKSMPEDGTEAN